MLKALIRWLWPKDAPADQKGRRDEYITRTEFEHELKRFAERQEYEFSEWYEKFSALHARLTKRIQRSSRETEPPKGESPEGIEVEARADAGLPSVLLFRRPGSV